MHIEEELRKITLPKIYIRQGKPCYFDTFRKKLIEITSEETVRQRVAEYFVEKLEVPREMLWLEVPMSYYRKGAKGRADIIIHEYDEKMNLIRPLAVIECKNETVYLTDRVFDQVIQYCDTINAKYIFVTNGIEMHMAAYQEETDDYRKLEKIISYQNMMGEKYRLQNTITEPLVRFSLEEMEDLALIQDYNDQGAWIFGKDSSVSLCSFSVNLYQCFLDCEHKLPCAKKDCFELIEDIGIRYMDYSNAGGGHYNGDYRAFLVKDRKGEAQIVSLSVFGTDAEFRGENRKSITSLVVSIDAFKTSHNSLQYNMDRFSMEEGDYRKLFHNGQIGNIKAEKVITYVRQNGCGVKFEKGRLYLGKLPQNRLLYMDDPEVSTVVYNLIEYALLREEVRKTDI